MNWRTTSCRMKGLRLPPPLAVHPSAPHVYKDADFSQCNPKKPTRYTEIRASRSGGISENFCALR
eukprot:12411409-Karenia_brevis.AAC.1